MPMTRIALTSLGCARNLVDSEVMLGRLAREGVTICDDVDDVHVVIINTCGFIQEAVEESIDAILQFCGLKKDGRVKRVIVAGCLVQRYGEELVRELPEVDGFVGVHDLEKISRTVREVLAGKKVVELSGAPHVEERKVPRVVLTPRHFRYVKICEGCGHACTFCAIPAIKGKLRSRSLNSILAEVRRLIREGAKEIVLIGQDTGEFGHDRDDPHALPELLREICAIDGDFWVRLLYSCPTHFTDELLEAIFSDDKVCRYVDLPIQHIDPALLKAMGRQETSQDVRRLIRRIRQAIPDVSIRTSLIVGFPGEGEEEFRRLLDFVGETKFDRLGAFQFSAEEGTPAATMPGQVPEEVKQERFDRLMHLQQEVSAENNRKLLGTRQRIIVDEWSEHPDYRGVGRTEGDAPEVDGCVYIEGRTARPGEFVTVEFTGSLEYDMIARQLDEPSQ